MPDLSPIWRMRAALGVFLGVASVAVVLILWKGPLAPVWVETAPVRRGELIGALSGLGTVEARRRYFLGPVRTGRLDSLLVDEGDRVVRGQRLGSMALVDLDERLAAAEAAVQRARETIKAAEARLADAVIRSQRAARESERYRALAVKRLLSLDALDAAQAGARSLARLRDAARADLDVARHALAQARAERDAVAEQIRELQLISPTTGWVVARRVEPGSVVLAGTPVLELVESDSRWIRTRIDQASSAALRVGDRASIRLRQAPDRVLSGRVARLEWIADSLTEERWVDVVCDDLPENAVLGSLAEVTVYPASRRVTGLWVPAAAVIRRGGTVGVWIPENGRAVFRPVRIGIRTLDGKVEIRAGLAEGETVVTHTERPLRERDRLDAGGIP